MGTPIERLERRKRRASEEWVRGERATQKTSNKADTKYVLTTQIQYRKFEGFHNFKSVHQRTGELALITERDEESKFTRLINKSKGL